MKTRKIDGELVHQYQAKDISDTQFMKSVIRHQLFAYYVSRWDGYRFKYAPGVSRCKVEADFPDVPWKVLSAKAAILMKRGFMDGCPCGCSGQWAVIF